MSQRPAGFRPNQQIANGRYRLEHLIGRGAFGDVWQAFDTYGSGDVAIKVLRDPDQVQLARFQLEIQFSYIPGFGNHPHLLTARTPDRDGDTPLLVFPYMSGGTLRDQLQRVGRLPAATAVALGEQVAQALGALHAHPQQFIHRDVHPGNIFFQQNPGDPHDAARWGELVQLGDFGLVFNTSADAYRIYGDTDAPNPGHVRYRAPEAAQPHPLTPAADVYGLGAVLWETLVGRPYSDAVGTPPDRLNPAVPAWLAALLMRCLAPAPAERPANGRALADLLRAQAAAAEPAAVPPAAPLPESVLDVASDYPYQLTRNALAATPRALWPLCDAHRSVALDHYRDGRFARWLTQMQTRFEQNIQYALVDELKPIVALAQPAATEAEQPAALERLLQALGAPPPALTVTPAEVTLPLRALADLDKRHVADVTLTHSGERGRLTYAVQPGAAWVQATPSAGGLWPGEAATLRLTLAVPAETAASGRFATDVTFAGGTSPQTVAVALRPDAAALARDLQAQLATMPLEAAQKWLGRLQRHLPGLSAWETVQQAIAAERRRRLQQATAAAVKAGNEQQAVAALAVWEKQTPDDPALAGGRADVQALRHQNALAAAVAAAHNALQAGDASRASAALERWRAQFADDPALPAARAQLDALYAQRARERRVTTMVVVGLVLATLTLSGFAIRTRAVTAEATRSAAATRVAAEATQVAAAATQVAAEATAAEATQVAAEATQVAAEATQVAAAATQMATIARAGELFANSRSQPLPGSTVPVGQVFVPAGPFLMGSNGGSSNEQPQREVTLNGFWIDQTEATNAQYAVCVAAGACQRPAQPGSRTRDSYYDDPAFADYPVIYVSWHDAAAYCDWRGAALPTEAQWEKAARGTDGRPYPWGAQAPDAMRANYGANTGDTAAVGSYPAGASPYGALDMAGNVLEWVADRYASDYYETAPNENPPGPQSGSSRVLRGGSWFSNLNFVRVAARNYNGPASHFNVVGFRCAQE